MKKKVAVVFYVILIVSLVAGISIYAMPQRRSGMVMGEHLSSFNEKENTQAIVQISNVVVYEAEFDAYRERIAIE